jgi:RNase P/RNase MRP subunit p29
MMGDDDVQGAASCATEEALREVRSQIDHLQDNIRVEYPAPDTPAGGAQRVRIEVRSPASLLTVGAQGSATAEGVPHGPGGIAIRTAEHFGAQITGRACFTTGDLTIVHAVGSMRVLTQADLGIAATHAIRVGTTDQNVEITAGRVPAANPAFTVDPAMSVPNAPVVDTATPRRATDSERSSISAVWNTLDLASSVSSLNSVFRNGAASGVGAGDLSAQVAGVLGALRSLLTAGEVLWGALVAAASRLDPTHDYEVSDPSVKIHGAGGVSLTSPEKVSAYATNGVSLGSLHKVSIAAGWKATVKSGGNAKLYGVASTTVQSEGAVGVKGRVVSASGRFVELKADTTAAVVSKDGVLIQAKQKAAVNGSHVAIAAAELAGMSSGDLVEIEGPYVHTWARRQNTVSSREVVEVKAGERLTLGKTDRRGSLTTGMEVVEGRITFDAGSEQRIFTIERNTARLWGTRFRSDEVSIHGLVVSR